MAHFAKIENDLVVEVIVAEQDFIDTLDGEWIQTSYNTSGNQHKLGGTPLRANYAGTGHHYDRENDVFYQPQPFNSWTLSNTTWTWEPPVARPETTQWQVAEWNEDTLSWDIIDTTPVGE